MKELLASRQYHSHGYSFPAEQDIRSILTWLPASIIYPAILSDRCMKELLAYLCLNYQRGQKIVRQQMAHTHAHFAYVTMYSCYYACFAMY